MDSFAAFLNRPQLFIRDGLHPNLNAHLNFSQLINELTHPNLNNPSKSNAIDLIFQITLIKYPQPVSLIWGSAATAPLPVSGYVT